MSRPFVILSICLVGAGLLCLGVFVCQSPAADGPVGQTALDNTFSQQITPLFKKYCFECHTGKKPEGNFSLEPYGDAAVRAKARPTWAKALRKIRDNEMPPKDSDQLPAADRDRVVAWCQAQIKQYDATQPIDPGRVTMRRLNRAEYNNTIRDLTGVDFKPAEDFPTDDVGYGFDNIGDVLWLPPLLMEKYLTAAENILDKAILVYDPNAVTSKRQEAEAFSKKTDFGEPSKDRRAFGFYSNGEISAPFEFANSGEYTAHVRAWGDQAGDEPCKMSIKIDGKEVRVVEVRALAAKPMTYEFKAQVEKGKREVTIGFINDFTKADAKDPAKRDRNLYVDFVEFKGKFGSEPSALPESHKKIMVAQPKQGGKEEAARKIIENFANHAFRRPVRTEEVERLMKLFAQADKQGELFERSIQVALQAILVSPHFLFRVEQNAVSKEAAAEPLNDYELASRLSFFLWSSMPDDTLLSLAFQGKLRTQLEPQIRRMLADPKSRALVENFAGQWLQTRRLKTVQPDGKKFPQFDEKLRQSMIQETELFFAGIVREDRSVLELIDSDYTYLNERLAKHYGITGVQGEEFQRVTLGIDSPRGGIVTQASILTATSNPTRTSPVKRGKWVLENLLAVSPPPPPEMLELPEDKGGKSQGTLRQRMEQHRANPNCTSCHAQLDPPGFGLENFDAIGAFRKKDGNESIDASGELPGGRSFNGPKELKSLLRKQGDLFCRCLAERMLTYAVGRGLEDFDDRTIDQLVKALSQHEYKFSALVIEIAKSEPFQLKRGRGAKP